VAASKSANPRYVVTLALIAGIILIGGWLGRPREIPAAPPPVPSETELQQLARRAERRSLESTTAFFAASAKDAAASLVSIAATQTTGVSWEAGRIVAAAAPDSEHAVDTSGGGPRLPVFLIDQPDARVTARRAEGLPPAGEWVLAVWRIGEQHAYVTGTFGHTAATMCGGAQVSELVTSIYFTRPMAGGGLFDLDGGLLALILPCEQRFAAITIPGVETMLRIDGSQPQRVFRQFGLMLADIPADAEAYFEDIDGLLVAEIRNGSIADLAELYAGDVLTAVNGTPIGHLSELEGHLGPASESAALQLRRGERRIEKTLSTQFDAADRTAASGGIRWKSTSAGFAIDGVEPGSRAARAGLRSGDRLLRIDYAAPRNVAQIERVLAAANRPSTLLEVARGDRRIAIFVK
jgi:S1-C subfamily serine protease